MPAYGIVSEVSQTLQQFLQAAMSVFLPINVNVQIHDLQTIPPNPTLLTIFLYEVVEDPSARNRPRERGVDPAGKITIAKPKMALLLRYLLTAWNKDPVTNQNILGRVLQVFYETSILSGPQLFGNPLSPDPDMLAKTDTALKITLAQLSLEERSRVWYSIQKPYRLSLIYEVRVVPLAVSSLEGVAPVSRRESDYYEPELAP